MYTKISRFGCNLKCPVAWFVAPKCLCASFVLNSRKLRELVSKIGKKKWSKIAKNLPGRIGKQCRERWMNHLKPGIKVFLPFQWFF